MARIHAVAPPARIFVLPPDAEREPLSGWAYASSPSDNQTVSLVDLDGAANLLRAKRQELLDHLDAVDRALGALTDAGMILASAQERPAAEPAAEAASPVVPTQVKPRRVLSDAHRHALTEGRRKARHAKDSAAGHAREALDPSPGMAPAPAATDIPRLVKRQSPGPQE